MINEPQAVSEIRSNSIEPVEPDLYNFIFLNSEINDEVASEVCSRMFVIDRFNQHNGLDEPIQFFINSPGGSVTAAFQICDIMDYITTPVHTIGMGCVASAGLMILMNGEFGERRISDRSQIMSHRFSWGVQGAHSQLVAASKEFERMHDRMVQHYVDCTGFNKKELESSLLGEHDCWLSPQEAYNWNLVDLVVKLQKKNKNNRKAKVKARGKKK